MKKPFKKNRANVVGKSAGKRKRVKRRVLRKPGFDKEAVKASFGSVTFRHGTYSVAAVVLVVIIAIAVNLIAGQLPESVKETDISGNKVYEISDTSREIIAGLEDDIDITVITEEDYLDDMLRTFLRKYVALSDHLSMDIVDPVLHPSVLEEYDTEEDTIVVECESTGLSQTISISDIMVQDAYSYYYGSGSITEFDGDGQLTSAISKVTGQETKKVYLASGHGETELSATMTSLMTKSAVETEDLDLFMTEEIPEDCDMLIFNGPTTDISEGEKSVVDSYIKNGGSVIMLMSEDTPSSGNLADLLSSYEITLEDGYVADMERNYLGNYYAIFPEVTDSSGITGDLSTGTVMVNNSRAFTLGESGDEIEVSSMMETSDYGYLVTDESQEEGSFVLAAAVTYTAAQEDSDSSDSTESADDTSSDGDSSSDGEVTTGNLIVFGSQSLIDESITEAFSNLDNTMMFMNVMTSALGDVQNLSIEAKSFEVQYNTVQNGGAISVFLIFIIPAAFLVAGFVFWYRRRKV